jgi:HSP20 family protein
MLVAGDAVVRIGTQCVRRERGSSVMKKHVSLMPSSMARDPFGVLRQLTSELDPVFEAARWPSFFGRWRPEETAWTPEIDVFERDNRLVTRVDLPGMRKEDLKVEVTEGHLAISGERKRETTERKEQFYRCEREYGGFYRAVPLPEGVKLEDVKAMFSGGVLEVSVPLPARSETKVRKVEVQEPTKAAKTAA